MNHIRITIKDITITAQLNDSRTAGLVLDSLPLESRAKRWGAEVFFALPVETEAEDPQDEVPMGAVAYWPPGRALCLFFGQQPYSAVSIVGQVKGDAGVLAAVREGDVVRIERV